MCIGVCILPRCMDISASLPAPRTPSRYVAQHTRTDAALGAPLGPSGVKKPQRFSFFFSLVGSKSIFVKVAQVIANSFSIPPSSYDGNAIYGSGKPQASKRVHSG